MSIEKRRHIRVNSLNLSFVCIDENDQIINEGMGRTLNVSESGILLEVYFSIERMQTVSLTLAIEEDLVDIRGRVVHSRISKDGKYEAGIEFSEIDENALRILKKFIEVFRMQHQSEIEKS